MHNSRKSAVNVQSFIMVLQNNPNHIQQINGAERFAPHCASQHVKWTEAGIEFAFSTRFPSQGGSNVGDEITLLLGDDHDYRSSDRCECMAHGMSIFIDKKSGCCRILTSIVGLPPLFMYKDEQRIVLSSDLFLLTTIHDMALEFDPHSVLDLCKVGHTTNHKTLFKDVVMIPGGQSVSWSRGGTASLKKAWEPQPGRDSLDWEDLSEEQIDAFLHAVQEMDVNRCFLALTSGLDTRAILSALVHLQRDLPDSYTISGYPLSLDAIGARELCRHYDIKHHIIILNELFHAGLEKYTTEACRLSGGVASLSQAHEVFFYDQIDREYIGRISGNLGNQVGRLGTEGISMRNASPDVIEPDLIASLADYDHACHWFDQMRNRQGGLGSIALLQDEVPNSSCGNYCIGNYYAVQKTPYADRKLIELAAQMPGDESHQRASLIGMRIKDLQHRFLGEPENKSFQRRLIKSCGGFASEYPINCGWKAQGGISARGTVLGLLSMIDALYHMKHITNHFAQQMLTYTGVFGLYEYRHTFLWIKNYLKEYIHDVVLDCACTSPLRKKAVSDVFHDYFYNGATCQYNTICFALDIALANTIFLRHG